MQKDGYIVLENCKEKFVGGLALPRAETDEIIDVIVFGSYIREDYDNDSDIDILVIVSDEKIEKDVRKVTYSFIPEIKRLISVKVVGRDTFNAMKKVTSHSYVQGISI